VPDVLGGRCAPISSNTRTQLTIGRDIRCERHKHAAATAKSYLTKYVAFASDCKRNHRGTRNDSLNSRGAGVPVFVLKRYTTSSNIRSGLTAGPLLVAQSVSHVSGINCYPCLRKAGRTSTI
jgi:hypothetical protein